MAQGGRQRIHQGTKGAHKDMSSIIQASICPGPSILRSIPFRFHQKWHVRALVRNVFRPGKTARVASCTQTTCKQSRVYEASWGVSPFRQILPFYFMPLFLRPSIDIYQLRARHTPQDKSRNSQ